MTPPARCRSSWFSPPTTYHRSWSNHDQRDARTRLCVGEMPVGLSLHCKAVDLAVVGAALQSEGHQRYTVSGSDNAVVPYWQR